MAIEKNKALVRRFYEEVWARGNVEFAQEVFAEDYLRHDLRPTAAASGPQGQQQIAAAFGPPSRPALARRPNAGRGDLVAARWTASGTNTGGWAGQAATGKPATFSGVNIFRIRDGKVAEIWNHRDDLGLAQQLGAPVYAGALPQGD
jgi:predicted SnoaL-like aldol condensation-catalyzing enzyme